jgi:2-amino-4-hydroxy-6-hydroxymethyldihydropteridine diphosphokinase
MNKTYLLLGSNIGNTFNHLIKAKKLITKSIGSITRQSSLYTTAAWGNTKQADFLNQVIIITTTLLPEELMQSILTIEREMGRIRSKKNAPRIIDIDILFYKKEILETTVLTVPHPQIPNRRFVLTPLKELSPNFIHPVYKKTIHQLLRVCPDKLTVNKI